MPIKQNTVFAVRTDENVAGLGSWVDSAAIQPDTPGEITAIK